MYNGNTVPLTKESTMSSMDKCPHCTNGFYVLDDGVTYKCTECNGQGVLPNALKYGMPIGRDLYHWPEFQAFAERLGIEWGNPTQDLNIFIPLEGLVVITHEYNGMDTKVLKTKVLKKPLPKGQIVLKEIEITPELKEKLKQELERLKSGVSLKDFTLQPPVEYDSDIPTITLEPKDTSPSAMEKSILDTAYEAGKRMAEEVEKTIIGEPTDIKYGGGTVISNCDTVEDVKRLQERMLKQRGKIQENTQKCLLEIAKEIEKDKPITNPFLKEWKDIVK